MIRLLGFWLRSKGATVLLSLSLIVLSVYYGVCFELQSRLDRELHDLAQRGARLKLSDYDLPWTVDRRYAADMPDARNAAPFYNAAVELCAHSDLRADDSNPHALHNALSDHPTEIAEQLKARDVVYQLLADGYRKPECAYRFEMTRGFDMERFNYLGMRSMFWRVGLQVLIDLQHGEVAGAVDKETWLLSFLHRFYQGGTLIEEVIKISCGRITLEPLQALADRGERADYSALLQEIDLETADAQGAMERAIGAERAMDLDLFEHLPRWEADFIGDPTVPVREYDWGGRPLHLLDELYMLSAWDRYEQGIKTHRPELLTLSPMPPPLYLVTAVVLPNMSRIVARQQSYLADLAQVRARLAALSTR